MRNLMHRRHVTFTLCRAPLLGAAIIAGVAARAAGLTG